MKNFHFSRYWIGPWDIQKRGAGSQHLPKLEIKKNSFVPYGFFTKCQFDKEFVTIIKLRVLRLKLLQGRN
jgi:hypothetical protein